MKRLVPYLLLAVVTAHAFYNAGVLGYWVINRADIAANLCENRDKPLLNCDGKCYLAKKIAAAAEEERQKTSQLPDLSLGFTLADCCPVPELPALLPSCPPVLRSTLLATEPLCCPRSPLCDIFHPPLMF
jgi:hypothetical protein